MSDPWGQDYSPRDMGNNPWADGAGTDCADGPRAVWRPNTAAVVITRCGHIELEWELIRILGSKFVKHVYCETCREWVTYRKASALDIVKARQALNQPLF